MKHNAQPIKFTRLLGVLVAGALFVLAQACTSDPNSPGVEYMPDMYRSPSIEPYVDYGLVGDSTSDALKNTQTARHPAANTVPRGHHVYPFPNSPEGYEAAGVELMNPLELNQQIMEDGKVLYGKFCVHCHGTGGKGDGNVAKSAKYTAVPPAYDSDELKDLPVGKMFHSIHFGKNKMGSHAGQISWDDRWILVNYVKYNFMQKELGEQMLNGETVTPAEEGDATEGDEETADAEETHSEHAHAEGTEAEPHTH